MVDEEKIKSIVCVGEIGLQSNTESLEEVSKKVTSLLKNKAIKSYLQGSPKRSGVGIG